MRRISSPVPAAAPADSGSSGRPGTERYLVGALLAAALLARISFVLQTRTGTPFFDKYFWLSEKLAAAGWLPDVVFGDCPFYIYLIGFFHVLLGFEETGVRIVQAFLSTGTVYLVWRSARMLTVPAAAFIAAAILAFSPNVLLYDTQPMTFTWVNFFNACMLFGLIRYDNSRKIADLAAAGAFLGVSAFLRPNVLLMVPLVGLWLAFACHRGEPRKAVARFLVLLALCMLAVSPSALINALSGGEFILVTSSDGRNLYAGNNPVANPFLAYMVPAVKHAEAAVVGAAVRQPLTPEVIAYRQVAGWIAGRELSAGESSAFWRSEALKYLQRTPGLFARGVLRKMRHFFNAYEAHDTESTYMRSRVFGPLSYAAAPIWALALLGMVAAAPRWRMFFPCFSLVLVYFVTTVAFYVSSRLRLPVMLPFAVFAGVGCHALARMAAGRKTKKLLLTAATLVALTAFFAWPTGSVAKNRDWYGAYYDLIKPGMDTFRAGNRPAALAGFEEAAARGREYAIFIADFLQPFTQDPAVKRFVDTVLYRQLSQQPPTAVEKASKQELIDAYRGGDYRKAVTVATTRLEDARYDWDARFVRGRAYLELGAYPDALRDLEQAFEDGKKFQPDIHKSWYEMAIAAAKAGDMEKARRYAARSLFVVPDYGPARTLQRQLAPP